MSSAVINILWACSVPAIIIIVFRLIYRPIKGVFDIGDWFAVLSLALIVSRLGLQHTAFTNGTGLVTPEVRASLTADDIEARELGSKTQFAGRVVFSAFIWSEKCVLFAFYQQLIHRLRWQRLISTTYWTTFALTFIAVELATLLDCRPFSLFFEVVSDPETCVRAFGQQITYGVCGILTDIMLIVLPLRILSLIHRPWRQKIQLGLLFSIGFFILIITIIRLQQVFTRNGSHVIRTVWGSAEVLASAIVANMPAIFGAYHLNGKEKYSHSTPAQITKTTELKLSSVRTRGQYNNSATLKMESETGQKVSSERIIYQEEFPKQGVRIMDIEQG